MTLEPGLEVAFRYTVTGADTAAAVGSGDVPVLATPRVLALAERATVAAVAGALAAGATTGGVRGGRGHPVPPPRGAGRGAAGGGGRPAGGWGSPGAPGPVTGRSPAAAWSGWWWTPPPSSATLWRRRSRWRDDRPPGRAGRGWGGRGGDVGCHQVPSQRAVLRRAGDRA